MKDTKYILILLVAIVFASCDDFLSEPPNKSASVVPTTTEQLGYLFNGFMTDRNELEGNKDFIFGSDDFGLLTRLEENRPGLYDPVVALYSTWDVNYIHIQDNGGYYPQEWKRIFTANMVLSELGNVSESDNESKDDLKAEAHFFRAYSYFQLVNTYCLPYSAANLNEPGLTIKASTSFEESSERVSLKETWDFILTDLEIALELNRDLELLDGGYRTWRASTPAINAFAA
ncbi:MAG: RagB/SusD family nutrient uptake outer membrane protein, partial [Bacteroidales bacterium]|nr:RagB/SusD family nutrient uptake outer membrane protein [Bacteroidales bacterium]